MAVGLTNAVWDSMLDSINAAAGTGAKLKIYTGTAPATGAAATGTLLVDFALNSPAFVASTGGSMALDVSTAISTNAAAAGTAGWARLETSTGTAVADFDDITATGGGGDVTMNSTTVSSGQTVDLTGGTLSKP